MALALSPSQKRIADGVVEWIGLGHLFEVRAGGGLGKPEGISVMQMPGTFVVGPEGRLLLAYYSETAADNPSIEILLDAVAGGE